MDALSISQLQKHHAFLLDVSKFKTINSNTLKGLASQNKITNSAYIHMLKLEYISKIKRGVYKVNITTPDPKQARILADTISAGRRSSRKPSNYTQEYISKVTQSIIASNIGESYTSMAEMLIEQIPGYYKDATTAITRISREYKKYKQTQKNIKETVKAEPNLPDESYIQKVLNRQTDTINDLKARVDNIEKTLLAQPKTKHKKSIKLAFKNKWNAAIYTLLIKT